MADTVSTQTIVCAGGYDSSQNHLLLDTNSPGIATDLLNYEVGLNGGYRRINGYTKFDTTYPVVDATNAEGRLLGLAIFRNNLGTEEIIAARKQKTGNTYKFYKYVGGTGWVAAAPSFTLSTLTGSKSLFKVRSEQFNFGNKNYIIFVDGVNFATLYDGTTWTQLKSTNTGGSGSPGGNQLIDSPNVISVFKNHIFLSRDGDYKSLVVHSAPLDPFTWTAAAGAGQLPTGFEVVQIKPFRDSLYVFGKNAIKNISVQATDFVINDVTTNIGCLAADSVVEVSGDLLFLAPDGIRPISGTDKIGDVQIATLSKPIQFFVNSLITTYDLEYLNSVVIRGKSQFRYLLSDSLGEKTGVGVIGGLRSADNGAYEFGRLQGISASCTSSGYYQGKELILHGGFDGIVYRQESGNSFDGGNITSVYETPYLTFGDPKIRKLLRTISVFYRLEGNVQLNITPTFDWDDADVLNPITRAQTTLYNIRVYGDGGDYGTGLKFGNLIRSPVIQTNLEGSYFSVKFGFSTSDTNPPHSIQGFTIEFTPQGRR